jgi:hypothetical protein
MNTHIISTQGFNIRRNTQQAQGQLLIAGHHLTVKKTAQKMENTQH